MIRRRRNRGTCHRVVGSPRDSAHTNRPCRRRRSGGTELARSVSGCSSPDCSKRTAFALHRRASAASQRPRFSYVFPIVVRVDTSTSDRGASLLIRYNGKANRSRGSCRLLVFGDDLRKNAVYSRPRTGQAVSIACLGDGVMRAQNQGNR